MARNTRTARFVQNTAATAAYQLTAMLLGFVTPRLMMLFYGSEVNGLIVSVTEFLTYFKLVEAGLASAAVVGLYKPLADEDWSAVSAIVSAARRFYNVAGLIFCGITVVFAAVYPSFVPVNDISGNPMSYLSVMLLVCAMGVSGALEFFTLSRYRVLLTADQRTYMVSIVSMLSLLLSTALIVALSCLRVNVIWVRLAASCTLVVRSLVLSRYVKKEYPQVDALAQPNNAPLAKRWDAMYQQITVAFHQGAGVVMTTLLTRDAATISVYGTYHMVTVGLWGVLKMTTTGIYSIFGNLLASGEHERFRAAYRDFELLYHAICTALFSTAAVLIVPFVVLYTKGVMDANYYAPLIGYLIIVEALTDHGKMPMDLMITAAGAFKETRHHCTAQVVCAVVLGLGLGAIWGVPGVLVGIILSNLLRTGLQLWYVPRHITHLPWQSTLKRILRMVLECAVIAVPLLLLDLPIVGVKRWLLFGVGIFAYASLLTALFAWLFDRQSFLSLIGRAKGLLKSRGKG